MLTHLVAIGLLGSGGSSSPVGPGDVIASPDRTVAVATVQASSSISADIPLGAYVWKQMFDPADHAPYAFDFTPLLDADEGIASVEEIAMNATAALLGVRIDDAAGYEPVIGGEGAVAKRVQVWFVVDEAQWQNASFNAGGVQLPVKFRITTAPADSTPAKRYERTAVLTVRQQ